MDKEGRTFSLQHLFSQIAIAHDGARLSWKRLNVCPLQGCCERTADFVLIQHSLGFTFYAAFITAYTFSLTLPVPLPSLDDEVAQLVVAVPRGGRVALVQHQDQVVGVGPDHEDPHVEHIPRGQHDFPLPVRVLVGGVLVQGHLGREAPFLRRHGQVNHANDKKPEQAWTYRKDYSHLITLLHVHTQEEWHHSPCSDLSIGRTTESREILMSSS